MEITMGICGTAGRREDAPEASPPGGRGVRGSARRHRGAAEKLPDRRGVAAGGCVFGIPSQGHARQGQRVELPVRPGGGRSVGPGALGGLRLRSGTDGQ